jgi:hypothetical protein
MSNIRSAVHSISFRHFEEQQKSVVVILLDGRRRVTLGWKASLECCQALDALLRNNVAMAMSPVVKPINKTSIDKWHGAGLEFERGENLIVVFGDGKYKHFLWDMRTDLGAGQTQSQARIIWSEWLRVTRLAEEWATRERIADDAAILHRSGAPFGLANHPRIREEAGKRADGDRKLRVSMKNGIRSREVLPPPTIVLDMKPLEVVKSLLPRMNLTSRQAMIDALKGKS